MFRALLVPDFLQFLSHLLSIDVIESLILDIYLQHLHLNNRVHTILVGGYDCFLLRLDCLFLPLLSEHRTYFFLLKDKRRALVILDLLKITRHEGIQDYLIGVLARDAAEVTRKGTMFGYLFGYILDVK